MIAEVRSAVCLGSARPCGRRVVTECFDWGNSLIKPPLVFPVKLRGHFQRFPELIRHGRHANLAA